MASETFPPLRNPRRMFIIVFVVLCALLAGAYYAFLRNDYVVLYSGLKPADASAVVTQLDAKGIAHKLREGGTTILVPESQADGSRLVVAGSDLPMKGAVGFELFNKSDMGLTDFAQKINYQRALQGELARTIMMMDGIETARIHLAIPERSLFRSKASTPRAAVEVIARDGQTIEPDRVAGIQQLVASAVPDLPLDQVVVLDAEGRILTRSQPIEPIAGAEASEQSAVQEYYSARARTALVSVFPGVEFGVHTLVLPPDGVLTLSDTMNAADRSAPSTSSSTGARNFTLHVTVVTPVTLNAEDQGIARTAVATAIALNEAQGDSLAFQITQPPTALPSLPKTGPRTARDATTIVAPTSSALKSPRFFNFWLLFFVAASSASVVWLVLRRQTSPLATAERDAFVARLRQQLSLGGDDAHV